MPRKDGIIKSVDEIDISHKLKLSYFIASVIPIAVMAYLYLNYISPLLEEKGQTTVTLIVAALLILTVFLSVLGLAMTNRAANDSINALKVLNVRMDGLLEMTKSFRDTYYIDVLMDSISNSATQVLGAEASSILLRQGDGSLKFEYLTGPTADRLKGRAVTPGLGISDWVAERGEPAIINDVKSDSRFSDVFDKETGFVTRSIICVPLLVEGQTIGVLEVLNKKGGGPFDAQDEKLLFSLADHAALSIQRSRKYESSHSDFIHVTEILLTAMDHHLPAKQGHARRVAKYAVRLAREMGLDEDEQRRMYFGSLLHDIGFLKYSQEDYWELKKFEMHPDIGYEMIKSVSVWEDVAELVYSHHERFDGGGYPRGLTADEISIGARILAVADAFDTMVSSKSYKEAVSFEVAVKELRQNAGSQFDPDVVDRFTAVFEEKDVVA